MSLVSNLLDSIVELIASAFSKILDGVSFLETLLGRAASPQQAPQLAAADVSRPRITIHEPSREATARFLTLDSTQQLDTMTSVTTECERMTLLVTENARLTHKQDQLQQIVTDLNEYALRLERDVEMSDSKATQLARELQHHRKLTISALSMYHSARHQLAAAELRQSVALAYVDELVAKYGRRDDGARSSSQTRASPYSAAAGVFELEEL